MSQWQIVFYVTAGINAFGGIVYLVFGSAKQQSWNNIQKYTTTIKEPGIQ